MWLGAKAEAATQRARISSCWEQNVTMKEQWGEVEVNKGDILRESSAKV